MSYVHPALVDDQNKHAHRLAHLLVRLRETHHSKIKAVDNGCRAVESALLFLLANSFDHMGVLKLDITSTAHGQEACLHFADNVTAVHIRTTGANMRLRSFCSLTMRRYTWKDRLKAFVSGYRKGDLSDQHQTIRDMIRYTSENGQIRRESVIPRDYPDFAINVFEELIARDYDVKGISFVTTDKLPDAGTLVSVELAKGEEYVRLAYDGGALLDYHRNKKG